MRVRIHTEGFISNLNSRLGCRFAAAFCNQRKIYGKYNSCYSNLSGRKWNWNYKDKWRRITKYPKQNILSSEQKFRAKDNHRQLIYGHIKDERGHIIDEVLAVYFPAPKTYTAEDVVEIDCHGGIVPLSNTLSLVLRCGADLAEPGEFTKRAFLNGRLDLTQAEAVIDVINSKTNSSFDVAMEQLRGKFSKEINEIRKEITDVLVDIAVNIDYPDEDIEFILYDS